MRLKVIALTSFISGCIFSVILSFALLFEAKEDNFVGFIVYASLLTFLVSSLLYVILTNFGSLGKTEIERIEIENQLLMKKIEQRELKRKLGE